jgi:hypothetical protein
MRLQILKFIFVTISVMNLSIAIYTYFDQIIYLNDQIPLITSNILYNNYIVLQDLKNLVGVGVPINGFDIIDKEYLNLLFTGSNDVDITSIRLHGVRVYAIRVNALLFTVENNLNLFLF